MGTVWEYLGDDEPSSSKRPKQGPIDKFAVQSLNTLNDILARCVAEDGMSVRALKSSKIVKSYLAQKGLKMPSSETTIWLHIKDVHRQKKQEYIKTFERIKNRNGRFSIIVDECSDVSSMKYLNVSLRTYSPNNGGIFVLHNLGLEAVNVSASACNI